jgi:hypothetical protein
MMERDLLKDLLDDEKQTEYKSIPIIKKSKPHWL